MRNLYILTAYNLHLNAFSYKGYFTNHKDKAVPSFDNLVKHLMDKDGITKIKDGLILTDSNDKTVVLGDKYNVSLIKHSISTEVSTFIKEF